MTDPIVRILKTEVAKIEKAISILGGAPARRPIQRAAATEQQLHWTQTPEGRAKLSRVQKRAWRERRAS